MMIMLRWLGIVLVIVVLLAVVLYLGFVPKSQAYERATEAAVSPKQAAATPQDIQQRREYVLEVLGLGVTLDKYRQAWLWDALQKGSAYTSIREQDPKKYPWSGEDKDGRGGTRAYDALENGINSTPLFWGLPSFYAGAAILDPDGQPRLNEPIAGLVAGAVTSGMGWHLFSVAPWRLDEHPDDLLNAVFDFFDAHPDVPYVALHAEDSPGSRDSRRLPGAKKKLINGYYIPDMPDATAVFILARRERVEPLRPYVWEDPQHQFGQKQFRAMYFDLMQSLPSPEKEKRPDAFSERQPTVPEWLSAAAAFAQRPDVRGTGLHMLDGANPWQHRPPRDWKPTPWFPIPWSIEQMATFDRLPSFGFVHRPVFVKFADEHGKPVERRDQRQKILNAGWQQALQTLPEAERNKGPSRIIAATGKQREQLLLLDGLLHDYAAQGGPEIDTGKSAQFIDTDLRLGNTGAATFFMQMAIGVMGSYREGGASAAINLRDRHEASIIFITPPSETRRKQQDAGGDIFRSRITPAVDPANYQAPSMEALLESQQAQ
ncbi:type VI lipase adapter Tla3 domain-containing protein [Janthinobacterium aquaticum]|uniref:type VI lipase adapter Tla3 domain-containing protein n=1 Tax=Janthinobacterium sp. FT58W TaxID=2654254 RepID=UPI001264B228|nr:DUF2875 family protein [Janthinobacterium sp. FT58W]KAB8042305.1 DUF2875 domain-containing protein [Janthinobacterium sp. FT58W]